MNYIEGGSIINSIWKKKEHNINLIRSIPMNIKQVARLLNDIGVETVATDTSLGPEVDYGVNYYKLMLNKDNNKWEFIYIPHERRSSGGEEIRKTFDNEASASKYYYLHELSTHYLFEYIQPFQLKNKDINIGRPSFNIGNLKETFQRLKTGKTYYSFNGKVKEHSMLLERVNKEESKVYFMGKNGKEILATMVLENWLAYSNMYKSVYYLYLFDQHYEDLLEREEVGHIFTDEDYKILIVGS